MSPLPRLPGSRRSEGLLWVSSAPAAWLMKGSVGAGAAPLTHEVSTERGAVEVVEVLLVRLLRGILGELLAE